MERKKRFTSHRATKTKEGPEDGRGTAWEARKRGGDKEGVQEEVHRLPRKSRGRTTSQDRDLRNAETESPREKPHVTEEVLT